MNGHKKKNRIFLACALAALLIAAVFLALNLRESKQEPGNAVVDSGATDWDIENDEEAKPDDIAIPGYATMVMKADELKQAVDIGNPAENNCYFRITLLLEDGTRLYQSDLLEPGKGFREIELEQAVKPGTYAAVIRYDCYSYDERRDTLNGAEAGFTLDVRE